MARQLFLALLLLLFIIALGWRLVPETLEEMRFAQLLTRNIEQSLGVQLEAQKKPTISLFPAPTLSWQDATINTRLPKTDMMVSAHLRRLEATLSWRSLLEGKFTARRLLLGNGFITSQNNERTTLNLPVFRLSHKAMLDKLIIENVAWHTPDSPHKIQRLVASMGQKNRSFQLQGSIVSPSLNNHNKAIDLKITAASASLAHPWPFEAEMADGGDVLLKASGTIDMATLLQEAGHKEQPWLQATINANLPSSAWPSELHFLLGEHSPPMVVAQGELSATGEIMAGHWHIEKGEIIAGEEELAWSGNIDSEHQQLQLSIESNSGIWPLIATQLNKNTDWLEQLHGLSASAGFNFLPHLPHEWQGEFSLKATENNATETAITVKKNEGEDQWKILRFALQQQGLQANIEPDNDDETLLHWHIKSNTIPPWLLETGLFTEETKNGLQVEGSWQINENAEEKTKNNWPIPEMTARIGNISFSLQAEEAAETNLNIELPFFALDNIIACNKELDGLEKWPNWLKNLPDNSMLHIKIGRLSWCGQLYAHSLITADHRRESDMVKLALNRGENKATARLHLPHNAPPHIEWQAVLQDKDFLAASLIPQWLPLPLSLEFSQDNSTAKKNFSLNLEGKNASYLLAIEAKNGQENWRLIDEKGQFITALAGEYKLLDGLTKQFSLANRTDLAATINREPDHITLQHIEGELGSMPLKASGDWQPQGLELKLQTGNPNNVPAWEWLNWPTWPVFPMAVKISLNASKALIMGWPVDDLAMDITSQLGEIQIKNADAHVAGGKLGFAGHVNDKNMQIDISGEDINLASNASWLEGLASWRVQLKGSQQNPEGTGNIVLKHGKWYGLNGDALKNLHQDIQTNAVNDSKKTLKKLNNGALLFESSANIHIKGNDWHFNEWPLESEAGSLSADVTMKMTDGLFKNPTIKGSLALPLFKQNPPINVYFTAKGKMLEWDNHELQQKLADIEKNNAATIDSGNVVDKIIKNLKKPQ
ncbi:MAG: hypothetical protein ACOYK8_07965 [Alphaproteobacteria bacterium]